MGAVSNKLLSARMFKAMISAGAEKDVAEDAAADVGELHVAVQGLTNRVNLIIGMLLLVIGLIVQIAFRLD